MDSKFNLPTKIWTRHIQWVCQNIVPNDQFRVKDVARVKTLVDKFSVKHVPQLLKYLKHLENVMTQHYITPIFTVGFIQHLQSMMHPSTDIIETISQHVILVYYHLNTLLKFIDIDLHNSIFYQTIGLIQEYHSLANASHTEESFFKQYTPFVKKVHDLIRVLQKLNAQKCYLYIPPDVIQLWDDHVDFVLQELKTETAIRE